MTIRNKIKGLIALAAAACCMLGAAAFTAVAANATEKFKTKDGAAVRLVSSDDKYGIRFFAYIPDYNAETEYNMMILPDVYRTAYYNAQSSQSIVEWAIGNYGEENLAIVKNCPYDAKEKGVYGSMVDIRYENLNREFCGYAYYVSDGKYVVSAEADSPLRSIKEVAEKAILSGNYNSEPAQLAVLNDYVVRAAKQTLGKASDEALALNKSEVYSFANESVTLNFGITTDSSLTSFSSTNEKVCTVDKNGLVTMIAPGKAKIKATLCGETAESEINVHTDTFDFSDESDVNWFVSDGPEKKVENGALTLTRVKADGKTSVVKLNRHFYAGDVIEITLKSEVADGENDANCHIYGLTDDNGAAVKAFYTSDSGISAKMQEYDEPNIGGNAQKHTVTLKLKGDYKGLYIDLHSVQTIYGIKISPEKTAYDLTDGANFIRFQNAADANGKITLEQQTDGVFVKAEAKHQEGVSRAVRFFTNISAGDKLLMDAEGTGHVYLYAINGNGDLITDGLGENNMAGSKVHTFTAAKDIYGFYLDIRLDDGGNFSTLKIKRIEIVKAGATTGERKVFDFDTLSELSDVEGKNGTSYHIENGKLVISKGKQLIAFRRNISAGTAIAVTLGNTNGNAWAYGTNGSLDAEINHLLKDGAMREDTDISGTGEHTVVMIAKDSFGGLCFNFSGSGDVYIEKIAFYENCGLFNFDSADNLKYFTSFGENLKIENGKAIVPKQENGTIQQVRLNFFIASGTKVTLTLGNTNGDAWIYGTNSGGDTIGGLIEKDGEVLGDTSIKGDGTHTVTVIATQDIYGLRMNFNNAADVAIDKIVIGEDSSAESKYVLPDYDESFEMNVGMWNGSYVNFTQADIDALKDAGVNLLVGNYPSNGDFLDMAAKAGISVIPFAKDWDKQSIDFSSDSHLDFFQQDKLRTMEKTTVTERTGVLKKKTYNVLHVTAIRGGNVLWFRKSLAAGSEVSVTLKADGDVWAYGINGITHDPSMIAETQIAVGGAGKTTTKLTVLKDTDGIYIMFNIPDGKTQIEGYIYSIETGESALPSSVRNSAVIGMCIYDEPTLAELEKVGLTQSAFAALLEENSLNDKIFFVNLLPDYAFESQTAYEEYVDAFLSKTKPQVISVDYYALMKDGTVRDTFFYNMNYLAEKSKETNVPLWYTLLTAQHGEYAATTAEQLRWQAAVAMTYGSKGILHYVYSGDSDHNGLMRLVDGKWVKNAELFAKVADIDNEISLWDHIYMSFDWQCTGTIGSSDLFAGLNAFSTISGKGSISATSGKGAAICGVFTDKNGNYGYMLTNASGSESAEINVSFGSEYGAVALIRNGVTSIVKTSDLSTIGLAAGEGVFMIPLK